MYVIPLPLEHSKTKHSWKIAATSEECPVLSTLCEGQLVRRSTGHYFQDQRAQNSCFDAHAHGFSWAWRCWVSIIAPCLLRAVLVTRD